MRPLEVPISAATSRTVVAARPFRRATARAASTIASRRSAGLSRAMSRQTRRYCAFVQQRLSSATRRRTTHRADGPNLALPRAHERRERDRPVDPLVRLPVAAAKYQISEKFEYFAIRNSAGLFDSSPLFKYRIHGRMRSAFLSRRPGPRHPDLPPRPRPVHDLVRRPGLRRRGRRRPAPRGRRLLADRGRTEPRLFRGPCGRPRRVEIDDVSERYGVLAVQGPLAGRSSPRLDPAVEKLAVLRPHAGEDRRRAR